MVKPPLALLPPVAFFSLNSHFSSVRSSSGHSVYSIKSLAGCIRGADVWCLVDAAWAGNATAFLSRLCRTNMDTAECKLV